MQNTQTAHLKQMMQQGSSKAYVLVITSGKGGVGKTNIAANLAICLASANKKVMLFDADLGLGNLDVLLNANCRYNLSHFISSGKTLDQISQVAAGNVELICGGSGIEELANLSQFQRQRLIDELDKLQDNYDFIVIDTGAGINASVINFCEAADHALVVTTPDPTAMTDAYAMIKVLSARDFDGRISLIVNMASSLAEGKKIYRQISDVAGRFLNRNIYEAGILCHDEKLISAVRAREPVVLSYPKSAITSAMVAMTARLAKGTEVRKSEDEGFFRKVVNWFF